MRLDIKTCKICKKPKKNILSNFGYRMKICNVCKANKFNSYYYRNKKICTKYTMDWYNNNKEKALKARKIYRDNNKEKTRLSRNKYYAKNKDRFKCLRRKNRLLFNYRSRVWEILKGVEKNKPTLKLLGCSLEYLKIHLENKFQDGMSWENYGKWHVDHIKPARAYDLTKEKEKLECLHHTNLQPLWGIDNCRKNSIYKGIDYKKEKK